MAKGALRPPTKSFGGGTPSPTTVKEQLSTASVACLTQEKRRRVDPRLILRQVAHAVIKLHPTTARVVDRQASDARLSQPLRRWVSIGTHWARVYIITVESTVPLTGGRAQYSLM